MPMREIKIDGKICRRMITNIHPDGTEFLPEEFAITGQSEQERQILDLARGIIESSLECEAREKSKLAK